MDLKFKTLGGLLVLLVASTSFPAVAGAESANASSETLSYEATNNAFDRAFFHNDRNFYGNRTFRRQLDGMFGSSGSLFHNSFPENEIVRDAELVNVVFRDVLNQQVGNDPYIRTPDLPNPYGTSLLMSPDLNINKLKVGTEFRFETLPPR